MLTNEPTQIIILGGTGDLARRKLIPALLDLYTHKKLPEQFSIVGMARTPRSDYEYRTFTQAALSEFSLEHSAEAISGFCEHLSYVTGSFDDPQAYQQLFTHIEAFADQVGTRTNRLFYLAVPPEYYSTIFKNLSSAGLMENCSTDEGWARVLVEKPFGSDLATAQALDAQLSDLFQEEQIFRIDHYLAKEAVQNILSFRFANTLMRSAWHNKDIKEVHIHMHETIDVANRGNFYDGIGALRDVGQNHLLQLLALVAMNEPTAFTADAIRAARAEILEKLIPINADTVTRQVARGQYEGYTDTRGVDPQSSTESYFAFTAYLDDPRWHNIPFHIEAGKGMAKSRVEISVLFNDVTTGPFEDDSCSTIGNVVRLKISPHHKIEVTLNAKQPGYQYRIAEQTLTVPDTDVDQDIPAYQKVLLDCIAGDQTLFTETNEVLASWRFVNSILENWHDLPLQSYAKGSTGPRSSYSV